MSLGLEFLELSYKNIASVGSVPVVIDLCGHKKTLITGKNGAGKSTMLEALCFALFGKPFRNIKKNQLINCVNKKALLVELKFRVGKDVYHIVRGIKPNRFEIKKNGEDIPEAASVKDFQSFFESDIIKMNMASFKQTIILGTAGYVPFMLLKAAERRTLIEDLINLSIYSKMDKLNKEVVKEVKQNMNSLEIKLSGLRNEYDAHMQHIQAQQKMSDDFVKQLQEAHGQHVLDAKQLKSEIDALVLTLSETVAGENYQANINKCLQAMATIDARVNAIQSDINFFTSNDTCPTCKQHISDDHKDTVVNGLIEHKNTFAEKIDKAKEMHDNYSKLQQEFNAATETIRKTTSDINAKKYLLTQSAANAKLYQKRIDEALNKSEIDTSRVDELDVEIKGLRDRKTDLFDELYARNIVVNMLKDSGLKAVVMNRYIPIINKKINHYLKILGADYTFTLDNEFNEVIKSRGREDFSYNSFSQGEKARIDLSLLFAWRDIASIVSGTEINLLVLDEVSDSATDAEGVKSIHNILDTLKANVFIISHREEHDMSYFNHHIRMNKKGRFSVMESE